MQYSRVLSLTILTGSCFLAPLTARAATSDATGFLKATMARYAVLRTYQTRCLWGDVFGQPHATVPAQGMQCIRTIIYQQPNRFKVVTNQLATHVLMTVVSDGKSLLEFNSIAGQAPRRYPSPSSVSEARTMQMQHPMFCGSLLYRFFGGPSRLSSLVKLDQGSIRFGPDTVVGGVKCRTVQFYGQETYGHTSVAISPGDHLVRRIVYDSAPLMAMVRKTMKIKTDMASTTTETYDHILVNSALGLAAFKTMLPHGVQAVAAPAPPSDKPPVELGQMAPDFTVASLKDGQPVKLSSRRGKLVLLDFWATWCPPCRASLPETQKLSQQYGAHGLDVMTIDDEDAATIVPFLTKNSYTFPVYRDTTSSASKAFHVNAIPTIAVIDARGRLAAYFVGLQDPGVVLSALKKAGLQPAS